MRLKLDENLSRHLKQVLAALRHDVTTAGEDNLLSQPDTVVARAAKSEARMLFTVDVEFGDLREIPTGESPKDCRFLTLDSLRVRWLSTDLFSSSWPEQTFVGWRDVWWSWNHRG